MINLKDLIFIFIICLTSISNSIANTWPEKADDGRTVVRTGAIHIDDNFRVRYVGIFDLNIPAGQTLTADWEIPAMTYGGNPATSSFNGGRFKVAGGNDGDYVTLQVVDKDYAYAGVLYPADYQGIPWSTAAPTGVLLDEFATNYYVFPDEVAEVSAHKANLYDGLEVRVIYTNTGASSARFLMNMNRLIETQ